MNKTLPIVMTIIISLAIAGCVSNTQEHTSVSIQSYTDGSINFNYTGDMQSHAAPGDIISGSKNWNDVILLADNDVIIRVQKSLALKDYDITYIRDINSDQIKQNGGSLLSTTLETNPNGVEVAKSINTITDPNTNSLLRYYKMYFKDNHGTIYSIDVYGYSNKQDQIKSAVETVFNSIKIK